MTEEEKKMEQHCDECGKELIEAEMPYCKACGIIDNCCPQCRESLPGSRKVCPHCGADIKE